MDAARADAAQSEALRAAAVEDLVQGLDGSPVGIVGLGLIGGSLGLDLQALGLEVRALVHRPATAERANQRRLASAVSTDPGVLRGCGLVILALPLDRLLDPAP